MNSTGDNGNGSNVKSGKRYRIAAIPGDGIGMEVVPPAIQVIDAACARDGVTIEWEHFPWGSDYYFQHGRMMPADATDVLRKNRLIVVMGSFLSSFRGSGVYSLERTRAGICRCRASPIDAPSQRGRRVSPQGAKSSRRESSTVSA